LLYNRKYKEHIEGEEISVIRQGGHRS
jgi:hypothetical protein